MIMIEYMGISCPPTETLRVKDRCISELVNFRVVESK